MVSASKEEKRHRYVEPAHAASEGQPSGQAPKRRRGQTRRTFTGGFVIHNASPSGVKPPPVATENELLEQGKAVWLWQVFFVLASRQPAASETERRSPEKQTPLLTQRIRRRGCGREGRKRCPGGEFIEPRSSSFMTVAKLATATPTETWQGLDWQRMQANVYRLQRRIFQASQRNHDTTHRNHNRDETVSANDGCDGIDCIVKYS